MIDISYKFLQRLTATDNSSMITVTYITRHSLRRQFSWYNTIARNMTL